MSAKDIIAKASEDLDAAQASFDETLAKVQNDCPHSLVVSCYDDGEEWRRCVECGMTEVTPSYHSFWFLALVPTPSRNIIESSCSELAKHRVDGSCVHRNPAKKG